MKKDIVKNAKNLNVNLIMSQKGAINYSDVKSRKDWMKKRARENEK